MLFRIVSVIASVLIFAVPALGDYAYDPSTGNSYSTHSYGGTTTTYGNNLNTGSRWNQTTNSNGSYSGQDSRGNFYNGDNNTGYYHNSGTGKTCFGKGAYRTCN